MKCKKSRTVASCAARVRGNIRVEKDYALVNLRRIAPAKPIRPVPSSIRPAGSGTAAKAERVRMRANSPIKRARKTRFKIRLSYGTDSRNQAMVPMRPWHENGSEVALPKDSGL